MEVTAEKEVKQRSKKEDTALVLLLGMVAVCLIGYIDAFSPVAYLYKAMGKAVLFVGMPLLYQKLTPDFSYAPLFRLDKKSLKWGFLLGFGVFSVIFGSYLATTRFVDLSAVTTELDDRLHIDAGNFVIVAIYIASCNSFLEEFFFRGFLFFRLKDSVNGRFAHITSSIIFSLYHVAIMLTWFDWWVFALCLLALVIGGVIFNLLDEKVESLYPSWITHACANIALNAIGMILFFGNPFTA